MLNTLSNQDLFPHDGKEITRDDIFNVVGPILNINDRLIEVFWNAALEVSGGTDTLSLDQLNKHNIIEHDGSPIHQDFYFGDVQPFNQTIFDQTRSYWTDPGTIYLEQAARAPLARIETSKATDPTYNATTVARSSVPETAIYILTMGDYDAVSAPRAFVEYFFEMERLPTELGWTKPSVLITNAVLGNHDPAYRSSYSQVDGAGWNRILGSAISVVEDVDF
ncbi:putative Heme haloperoxidase family profile domain-containing protein [Seiridium cardinale]|uniref:Heme haloperoxidase family profile domain-containing protein n=1 Tax=Seiridium cardinale TaxID=138064 RepID=A0ABR2XSM2_9PEZI